MKTKIIDISELYIAYPDYLTYQLNRIETDGYLKAMINNIANLPPIPVIQLDNEFSISNGYHRLAVFISEGYQKIRVQILN